MKEFNHGVSRRRRRFSYQNSVVFILGASLLNGFGMGYLKN
jgi:hypothetical protein